MVCEGLGGRLGDPGEWQQIEEYLHAFGIATGPPCLNQTTGGVHASTSNHYKALALDVSRNNGGDEFGAVRVLRPLFPLFLSELYHAPTNTWLPSNVGGHTDHVHAAIRAGARLPFPRRKEDTMGAYPGESIHPGERKTFRIVPPGGGALGDGYADPVYISIPFDAYDDPAHPNPAKYRWAIVDASGKWIDGNGAEGDLHTGGVVIEAHTGAHQLSVENHEPAGGRIIGPPLFEWEYRQVAGAMGAGGSEGHFDETTGEWVDDVPVAIIEETTGEWVDDVPVAIIEETPADAAEEALTDDAAPPAEEAPVVQDAPGDEPASA